MPLEQRPIPWHELAPEARLRLREESGRYLDTLPPTCATETKVERFRQWLAERGIASPHVGD